MTSGSKARFREIEYLHRIGDSLQVRVLKEVTGGLRVYAGVIAFMPQSHVDIEKCEDLGAFVGETLDVLILKCDVENQVVVVSRRAYLERAQRIQAARTLTRIKVGDICDATITNINKYGLFVKVGGVDGLVPLLDVSWRIREGLAHDYEVGQSVRAMIRRINKSAQNLDLTIRGMHPNPWTAYEQNHQSGQLLWCRVLSVLPHGAYFELAEGVYGFAHVSELSEQIVRQASDVVSPGDEMWMKIIANDKNADYRDIAIRIFPDLFRTNSQRRTPYSHFKQDGTPKVKYRTYAEADEKIREVYERGHNGNLLYSYRCRQCSSWHFGGTAPERWTLSRVRAELEGGVVAPEWSEYFNSEESEDGLAP